MKRRLALLMIAVFVPVLALIAYGMSERSFALSMAREQERAQMTEAIIAADVKRTVGKLNYNGLQQAARQYRSAYAAQGVELILAYNGKPMGGAELPDDRYGGLFIGERCAMLDTASAPQRYVIAEPVTQSVTLLVVRDVSDVYSLRDDLRRVFLLYALAGAAVVAGLAYLLAWRFTRPVARLTAATDAVAANADGGAAELPVQRRDELGVLARSFADMQSAVRSREAALREEAANRKAMLDALAHEMRTPLCALLGNARLMQNEALPQERRNALLDDMAREVKRLSDMDAQLMKLVSLSREPIERRPVSVRALLLDTVKRVGAQADGVALLVTDADAVITGDAALLSLLCDNLTVNAVRASKSGQTVTLCSTDGGFTVRDEGAGMTEEQLSHAFEPFYKADKARTRRAGGAGLGLSLCRRIAELHGGALTLASQIGAGTTASFTTSLQPVADFVTSQAVSSASEVVKP